MVNFSNKIINLINDDIKMKGYSLLTSLNNPNLNNSIIQDCLNKSEKFKTYVTINLHIGTAVFKPDNEFKHTLYRTIKNALDKNIVTSNELFFKIYESQYDAINSHYPEFVLNRQSSITRAFFTYEYITIKNNKPSNIIRHGIDLMFKVNLSDFDIFNTDIFIKGE